MDHTASSCMISLSDRFWDDGPIHNRGQSPPGNLRPAGLLCHHPLLQHHHVGLPHTMEPPEENTQHPARAQQQPTRGWRRGKRGGGPLCIRSLSNCLVMLLGVCCAYSLFNALSVIIKWAELDPESADPSV